MTNRRRQLLIGVVLVMFFSAFPAYSQTQLRPLNNLSVYDGDGKRVGNVINFWGEPPRGAYVAFSAGQSSLVLTFFSYGIAGFDTILYFESTDCSGDPFFSRSGRERIFPYSGVKKGMLYTANPTAARRINVMSVWLTPEEICQLHTIVDDGIPAVPLIDIRAGLKNGSLQPEGKKEGCRIAESRETKGALAI